MVQLHLLRCGILEADSSPNDLAITAESLELSNTLVLPQTVETISLKLTKAQAKLLAEASKDRGFPSKSEFVRYAIARALEDRLSVKTIEDIFDSRRQIRAGKTIPLERLMEEG